MHSGAEALACPILEVYKVIDFVHHFVTLGTMIGSGDNIGVADQFKRVINSANVVSNPVK